MPIWFVLLVPAVAFLYYYGARWGERRTAPAIATASPELLARLGHPLAAWHDTTKHLAAALVVLEDHAQTMLAQEATFDGKYALGREHEDVAFLLAIREMRKQVDAWCQAADALDPEATNRLRSFGVEVAESRARLDFRWDTQIDRFGVEVIDRSEEIRAVLRACVEARRALAEIVTALTSGRDDPFRAS